MRSESKWILRDFTDTSSPSSQVSAGTFNKNHHQPSTSESLQYNLASKIKMQYIINVKLKKKCALLFLGNIFIGILQASFGFWRFFENRKFWCGFYGVYRDFWPIAVANGWPEKCGHGVQDIQFDTSSTLFVQRSLGSPAVSYSAYVTPPPP